MPTKINRRHKKSSCVFRELSVDMSSLLDQVGVVQTRGLKLGTIMIEHKSGQASTLLAEPVADRWHIRLFEPLRQLLPTWPVLLPSKLGDPIRPLAIGTDKALIAMLLAPDQDATSLIKQTIRRYCMTEQYARAMARDGAMRHDLNGNPVEPIPENQVRTIGAVRLAKVAGYVSQSELNTTEAIMVAVKSLKITAVIPADQLKPSEASTVALTVTGPDGAKATAMISGKTYRRALTQIASIGADQAVVILQGALNKLGEIDGAGIAVTPRKAS